MKKNAFNTTRGIIGLLLFAVLWVTSCSSSINTQTDYNTTLQNLVVEFEERLWEAKLEKACSLPPIVFDSTVTASAVWRADTIRVGLSFFSQGFVTEEDQISILFHEYNHFLNEHKHRYPCLEDLSGSIVQVETDILIEKELTIEEIEYDFKELVNDTMSSQEKQLLREMVSKPSLMRFVYAPSNLSRDELHCYRAEKRGHEQGLFHHSDIYASFLSARIKREEEYLKLRIRFEELNTLRVDGSSR